MNVKIEHNDLVAKEKIHLNNMVAVSLIIIIKLIIE